MNNEKEYTKKRYITYILEIKSDTFEHKSWG